MIEVFEFDADRDLQESVSRLDNGSSTKTFAEAISGIFTASCRNPDRELRRKRKPLDDQKSYDAKEQENCENLRQHARILA